jgi:asparagine synthetase B (glutamine-hydrolysing)
MNNKPFISARDGMRYQTAKEAGEVRALVVNGHIYNMEDLPRRIAQFHDLRETCNDLFTSAQKTMT